MRKTRKVIEGFYVQPITPEYIANRIIETHNYVNKQIESIRRLENPVHQMILLFALLEAFAQEYANYPAKLDNCSIFSEFVLTFQKSFDFLNEVDPITLFYQFEEEMEDKQILDGLSYGRPHYPMEIAIRDKYRLLIIELEKMKLDKSTKQINKHRYVNLLYRLRNKLSHEMTAPFPVIKSYHDEIIDLPFYPEFPGCVTWFWV